MIRLSQDIANEPEWRLNDAFTGRSPNTEYVGGRRSIRMSTRSFVIVSIIVALLAAAAIWMHRPQAARSMRAVLHGGR
jgi:hypothetical protein